MSNLKKLNNAMLALVLTVVVAIIDMKRLLPHDIYSLLFVVGAYVYLYVGILAYKNKDTIREKGIRRLKKFGYYFFESFFTGLGVYGFYRNLPFARAHGLYIYLAFVGIIYLWQLIYRYGWMITDKALIKKYSIIAAVMWVLHDCVYLFPANDTRPGKVTGSIFILVYGLIVALYFFDYSKLKRINAYKEKRPVKFTYIMYLIAMWLIFATIETLSKTFVFQIMPWNWLMNMIWIFLFSGLIYLITKKMKPALIATLVVWAAMGFANGFLILFRGSPILPADLSLISTAAQVSNNYSYELSYYMIEGLYVGFFTLLFILKINDTKPVKRNYRRFLAAFLGTAVLAYPLVVLNSNIFDGSLNLWRPVKTYRQFGAINAFSLNLLAMQVQEPEGYSVEAAQKVLEGYESDEVDTTRTPNIIVVMDESFADLTKVGDYKTNKEVMPYYNSLKKNIIKGTAYSSVLGGGTANSEYEFQSGNAITFLPTGTIAYQQYIQGDTNSFTRTLKSLGYSATAFHAYQRNTYRREIVYPLIGFDQYYGMESIEDPDYLRCYITDESDFDKLIELYEERDTTMPFYMFNITMQNHSSYDLGGMDYNIKVKTKNDYSDANEYLSCISHTDESIKTLIDYFSKVDEETYIVFYGDHQPNLYSGFFEELLGGEIDQLSVEDLQKRYTVPFFIWSNKEMESKTVDKISLNYLSSYFLQEAKLPMTAYNKYLMDLYKKYPVININGYITAKDKYYDADEIRDNPDLVDYNKLVYNTIIDKCKGLDWAYKLQEPEIVPEETTSPLASASPEASATADAEQSASPTATAKASKKKN